ncbi:MULTISPECIES: YvrJ family protein [Priestia]|uniref:YvrJ family protein n=1 Tax=Priestia TaxID=2800373 RepID=UPI001B3BCE34
MYAPRTRTQKSHIIIYDFISYIKELGFPIALSFYLLIRIESKLEKITELLQILIGKRTSYNLIHLFNSSVKNFLREYKSY